MPPPSFDDRNRSNRKPAQDVTPKQGETTNVRPRTEGQRPNRSGDDLDFGAFVSSSVTRSTDKFLGRDSSRRPERSETHRSADAAPADETETTVSAPSQPRRDSRYWRNRLDESSGERPPQERQRTRVTPANRDADDYDDGGAAPPSMFGRFLGDEDDPDRNRNLIVLGLIALLVLALLIFGLTQLIGGGGDDDPEPTPTPTIVDETVVPGGGDGDTTEGPSPTETPEIPRGGDNQREDGGDEPEPEGRTYESEIARTCSGQCLVRVVADDVDMALDEHNVRASFRTDGAAWAVVTPGDAEDLDAEFDLTMVEPDGVTYNLYSVTTPAGMDASFSGYGTVIDAWGADTMVAFDTVPAVAKPLTDAGYVVTKIEPGPPNEISSRVDRPLLSDASGASLMDQVSTERIERLIGDLSSVGELDNSGLGTRYYAYPGNQIAADYIYQELESYGLDVWYEDFLTWDGLLLVNVIAEIPGSDDSSRYAVMSHFDSMNTTNTRQAPGADDNSSGISVNLEIARILSRYQLSHPVRFAFVNMEENGLQGATEWARKAQRDGLNIQGVLNVDSVGSSRNRTYIATNSDGRSAWLQDVMTDVNDEFQLGQVLQHLQDPDIVADDNMVRDEGIPAIMIARELYGWTDIHHTTSDVAGNVSIDAVESTTYIVLLTVVELAA